MSYNNVTATDVNFLRSVVGADHCRVGDAVDPEYAHDELGEASRMPDVVLWPDSTEQVAAVMKYAHARRLPVTTRGAGTGLCGGCVPLAGGIVMATTRLNRILEIDENNLLATVQPGVVLLDLQERVERLGLMYAPDPGERSATVGGNVATNAGGMRAVKYGVTRDHVTGMEVVLANGDIIQLGGKVKKNASGYSLLHLMIGSEGTLGIMTRITVKLLPLPRHTVTLLVPFSSLERAIGTVPEVIKSRFVPQSMEFMERDVLLNAQRFLGKPFPHTAAPAYLMLRFDGNNRTELDAACTQVAEVCLAQGAEDVFIADTSARQNGLWDTRAVLLEALKAQSDMDEVDVVVPPGAIAEFVAYTHTLQHRFGVRVRSFGHAGDGNTHVYLLRDDLARDVWRQKKQEMMRLMYEKGRELGGQVSGEHGIGSAKRRFLIDDLGPTVMDLQRHIKNAFDPHHILNPGKIV